MYDFLRRDSCPVCEMPSTDLVSFSFGEEPLLGFMRARYRRDASVIANARYTVARCSSCTLLFQRDVGADQFLTEFYTNWVKVPRHPMDVPTYQRDIENVLASRDAHEILTAAAYLRRDRRELKTLDYGMGWGLWAQISKELGCESWGFDLSPARMRFAGSVGIRLANVNAGREGGFHFINTEQVLEHLTDPFGVAAKLTQLLAPGGILKVSVPSAEAFDYRKIGQWLAEGKSKKLGPLTPIRHVNGFTRRALEVLAARLGIRPVRPSLAQRYQFLRTASTVNLFDPKQTLKELVRPIAQYYRPSNLYVWFEKPPATAAASPRSR